MQLIHRFVLILSLCPAVACAAEELRITIDANGAERRVAPLTGRIEAAHLPDLTGDVEAWLLSDGREPLAVQLQRDGDAIVLRWIEPHLRADESRTYTLSFDQRTKGGGALRFVAGDGFRDLYFNDRPLIRHVHRYDANNHDQTHKPFHHVFRFGSRDGFITNGPGGQYPHHRGIFFGFNKTPHGDFWHCRDISQQHRRYLSEEQFTGPVAAGATSLAEWVNKAGEAVVRDTRRVTTWRIAPQHLVLDFEITLETLTGESFALAGDAHHAGFHFRAANEVAQRDSGARFTYAPGAQQLGNDVWAGTDHVHSVFEIAGKPYAVTLLNHPDNPQPTTWSTRPYGRFGAFFTHELQPKKPLTLRYRVIIRDGAAEIDQANLGSQAQQFAQPVRVDVER